MDRLHKNPAMLFAQLGLANDPQSIANFIAQHSPLAGGIALSAAPFWNNAQRTFLQEALARDADWSDIVDGLNTVLR